MIVTFIRSAECCRRLDSLGQVSVVYRVLLGREADEAGRAHWRAHLDAGKGLQTMVEAFVACPEFALAVVA